MHVHLQSMEKTSNTLRQVWQKWNVCICVCAREHAWERKLKRNLFLFIYIAILPSNWSANFYCCIWHLRKFYLHFKKLTFRTEGKISSVCATHTSWTLEVTTFQLFMYFSNRRTQQRGNTLQSALVSKIVIDQYLQSFINTIFLYIFPLRIMFLLHRSISVLLALLLLYFHSVRAVTYFQHGWRDCKRRGGGLNNGRVLLCFVVCRSMQKLSRRLK